MARPVAALLGGAAIAFVAAAVPHASTSVTYHLADGRAYLLHAPSQRVLFPRPVVLALHAAGHTPSEMEAAAGLDGYADAHGLIVAYGEGVDGRWNAGGCCAAQPVDDLAYLRAVVADIGRRMPIDRSRVYVVGFSNGGMMAWRAVCQAPDVFAAAGVVAGALLVPCPTAVHVYHVHGTGDGVVPLAGGRGFDGYVFPDSRFEQRRVGAGSVIHQQWWPGRHDWPAWTADTVLPWLTRIRLSPAGRGG
jgi:polyhydroxybutyrate depolymerase